MNPFLYVPIPTNFLEREDAQRFCELLGEDDQGALRLVLWLSWVAAHRPDGKLGPLRARRIARHCLYSGDASRFIDALVDSGWCEIDEAGGAHLPESKHAEFFGHSLRQREKWAAKKERQRSQYNVPGGVPGGHPPGVPPRREEKRREEKRSEEKNNNTVGVPNAEAAVVVGGEISSLPQFVDACQRLSWSPRLSPKSSARLRALLAAEPLTATEWECAKEITELGCQDPERRAAYFVGVACRRRETGESRTPVKNSFEAYQAWKAKEYPQDNVIEGVFDASHDRRAVAQDGYAANLCLPVGEKS